MGYTILLQWSYAPPNGQTQLVEIIINRLLEQYSLSTPLKSAMHLRTHRATFPPGPSTKTLTAITYTLPVPTGAIVARPDALPRDDTAFLFLDNGKDAPVVQADSGAGAAAETGGVNVNGSAEPEGVGDLAEDGFEIVNKPDVLENGAGTASASTRARGDRYQILSVRPANGVIPLLQNLLSPFVLGMTKAARAAAATTSEAPRPTPIQGTTSLIATLVYPALSPPQPPLIVSIHALTGNAPTVLLEGEWAGETDPSVAEPVLRDFLGGCVPDGLGQRRFWTYAADWAGAGARADTHWDGTERAKRTTALLARALKDAGVI